MLRNYLVNANKDYLMNFRALFLSIQRVLGIFSSRENDVAELMMKDVSSLSPFAQIIGDQKYTVPDHPNLEVLKFIELKWFTEFGHLNRGDMLTSEQHRCHNEKKKFQRRV